MLPAVAGLLVPLLAFAGAHVHYDAMDVRLQPDPACPVAVTDPLVLRFDETQACASLAADVVLPPGTVEATWDFLHSLQVWNSTVVVENIRMADQVDESVLVAGDMADVAKAVTMQVGAGPATTWWSWNAYSQDNVSAQVALQALRLHAVAPSDASLRLDEGARWIKGTLVDHAHIVVAVPEVIGWQPWLRFHLGQDMVPTSLMDPSGHDLLEDARWQGGVVELPAAAMEGPGEYRLNVRLPGVIAPEASLGATFLIILVGMGGAAALAGVVLMRHAEGPGLGRKRRVRAYAVVYGLLITTSALTLWQTLVTNDVRIMLQSPLHPVATAQYLAMLVHAVLFLLLLVIGGADIMRHLNHRVRSGQHVNQDLVHAQEEMKVFTVAAAHDLKSPLRAIHAYADLMQRNEDDPANTEILESIKGSARRMTEGVEALLQFTRVASTQPHPRNVDVTSLVDDVQQDVQSLAKERGIVLVQEGDAVVHADRMLLHRALENLVENALIHGPQGGRVTVRAVDDGAAVRLEVVDEGDPIPEPERSMLFEAFHRGARADVRGTGLGLATVAKVAEMHGGQAGVSCDGGNRFWIRMPGVGIEVPHAPANHPIVPPDVRSLPHG